MKDRNGKELKKGNFVLICDFTKYWTGKLQSAIEKDKGQIGMIDCKSHIFKDVIKVYAELQYPNISRQETLLSTWSFVKEDIEFLDQGEAE